MRRTVGALCVTVLTAWSSRAAAQSVDSLTKLLRSRDVHIRGDAVARLAMLDTPALPAATRTAIISLLEHEALGDVANAGTMPLSENDESWGDEISNLTDLVIRLHDARALRGVALIGMQTSKAAQEFLAGFGPRAMPFLDESWSRYPDTRHDVDITWGIMLAPGHPAVDAPTRAAIASRLLARDDTIPLGLSYAAREGSLPSLVPLLDSLATTVNVFDADELRSASKELTPKYAQRSSIQRVQDLQFWLDGVCTTSRTTMLAYCAASKRELTASTQQLDRHGDSRAATSLRAFIAATSQEVRRGSLSPIAAMLFVTSAERVIDKLRP
jgi:hypothetical protein